MDYEEYRKQKALEEVVRRTIERVKESTLHCPLYNGNFYKIK
ncbi:MAG: hypothetical protein PHF86_12515 [Candidatus Nanoarchaeia archaeon]|nr:hypothetical protein [Candidatus Nanoarchaeia archaeon]